MERQNGKNILRFGKDTKTITRNEVTMKLISVIFFSFIFLHVSFAQDAKTKQKISDAFEEAETGALALRFFDAITGNPIKSAHVEIVGVGEYDTDFEGKISFSSEEENTTLQVKFTHPKYITSEFKIEVMAGTLFFNRFSVSPKMPLGSLRVVVDWSDTPKDLDAHLVKKGGYHISYRNMRNTSDGAAKLDRDDTDGFGPETITAAKVDANGEYYYFIHDFSDQHNSASKKLSDSKASVKVYGKDNELLNVFTVPQDQAGTYWKVFKIIGGEVIPINEIGNSGE